MYVLILLSLCINFFLPLPAAAFIFALISIMYGPLWLFPHPSLPFSNGPSLTSYFICYERGVTKDKTYLGQVVKLSAKILRYL